jgi:hypothetical protein
MNPLQNPLDGFSPELYIATLSKMAHSDGLHPTEQDILEQHAAHFGIALDNLPDVPDDLSKLPWATRVLVYRDAFMLALADAYSSAEEQQYLADLAKRMELPPKTTDSIASWVEDYGTLLERFDVLLNE